MRIIQSKHHTIYYPPSLFNCRSERTYQSEALPTFSHHTTSNQSIPIQSLPGSVHWQFGRVDQSETLPSCCHQRLFPRSPVSIQIYSLIRIKIFYAWFDSYWTLFKFSVKYLNLAQNDIKSNMKLYYLYLDSYSDCCSSPCNHWSNWPWLLEKFWPMVKDCVLRTAASSIKCNYEDPPTS